MKKIFFFLGFILSVFIFSSCDKDKNEEDDKEKHIPVFNNKKLLVYCSENESGLYGRKYEYDSYGKLIKVYKNGEITQEYNYDYDKLSFNITNSKERIGGSLTTTGFIEQKSYRPSEDRYYSYSYDEDWHLKSETLFNYKEDECVENVWTWVNDNVVTLTVRYYTLDFYGNKKFKFDSNSAFKYTNDSVPTPIENKAGIPFLYYSLEEIEPIIAIKNLLGVSTKNLPVSFINSSGKEYRIDWTLDNEGYPVRVDFDKKSLYFTWN